MIDQVFLRERQRFHNGSRLVLGRLSRPRAVFVPRTVIAPRLVIEPVPPREALLP